MITSTIDKIIVSTREKIDKSKALLSEISSDFEALEQEEAGEDAYYHLRLLLQYRLSSQNALNLLLHIQQNLLALLGIQPGQSAAMNLDKLAYLLGFDEVSKLLNILSFMLDALTKAASHNKKVLKQKELNRKLQQLNLLEDQLVSDLEKIEEYTEACQKLPLEQLDLDYIASLTGPILQFYEEVIHRLGLEETIYQVDNVLEPAHQHIKDLIKEVLPSAKSYPHPGLGLFEHKKPTRDLEQIATAKRLRPFF